ncbi:MAG: hypothetical protein ACRDAU_09750 [Clostridium sp.]
MIKDKKDFEDFDQVFKEEKVVDSSNPCDPSHPDYPWVPCGIDKKDNK